MFKYKTILLPNPTLETTPQDKLEVAKRITELLNEQVGWELVAVYGGAAILKQPRQVRERSRLGNV
jgi:hypothetical protein